MWTAPLTNINKHAKDWIKMVTNHTFRAADLSSFSSCAQPQNCVQHFKSPEKCAASQRKIMYARPCLCVCEGRKRLAGGGACRWALVFVRKSCLTICCLPPQRTHIWNWSSTVSCSQQRGQRECKVTAKDLPQSVMGCGGGLMCHATAVVLRTLTSTSSLLQNITLITLMPDCLSACRWTLLRLP